MAGTGLPSSTCTVVRPARSAGTIASSRGLSDAGSASRRSLTGLGSMTWSRCRRSGSSRARSKVHLERRVRRVRQGDRHQDRLHEAMPPLGDEARQRHVRARIVQRQHGVARSLEQRLDDRLVVLRLAGVLAQHDDVRLGGVGDGHHRPGNPAVRDASLDGHALGHPGGKPIQLPRRVGWNRRRVVGVPHPADAEASGHIRDVVMQDQLRAKGAADVGGQIDLAGARRRKVHGQRAVRIAIMRAPPITPGVMDIVRLLRPGTPGTAGCARYAGFEEGAGARQLSRRRER